MRSTSPQETFAVAWRRLDDVPQGEPALHWLYGTARRVLANHLRSERRRAALTSAIEREPAVATSLGVSARSPRVAAAFAQLRDDERELLLLVAWEELKPAAVAAILGCSQNAARIRLHRARLRFAQTRAAEDSDTKCQAAGGQLSAAGAPTGKLELEDSL